MSTQFFWIEEDTTDDNFRDENRRVGTGSNETFTFDGEPLETFAKLQRRMNAVNPAVIDVQSERYSAERFYEYLTARKTWHHHPIRFFMAELKSAA